MIRLPPRSTRTDTLFPYTTLFRSVGGAGGQLAFSSQNIGAAAQYVGPFPHWQRRQSQRRRGGIEQLEFPFRRRAEQDTKAEHRSALPRLYTRRSEERRVGKACVRTVRSRGAPHHIKTKN